MNTLRRGIPRLAGPVVALSLAVALGPAGLASQETPDEPDRPTITVNGTGVVEVDPDVAVVRVGVENQAEDARAAQDSTSRVAGAILEAVRDLGVPMEKIQTSRLDLRPVYARGQRPEEEPVLRGYRAANTVSIELEDLSLVGPAVDAAIAAGANRIEGVEFGLSDPSGARTAALAAAVEEARAKAVAIAEALGVELGAVIETIEQGVSIPRARFAMRVEAMEMQQASTPVASGQLSVTASLLVRYRIAR